MEIVTLSRIIERLESGAREKGGSIDSGIRSIGGTHLSNTGGFKWDKKEFVSTEFYNKMRNGKIQKNDILIVKDGATTGKVSFVDDLFPYEKASINEHVFRLQINPSLANPKFIFYFLFSPKGQEQILSDFRGATIGGISRGFIDKVEIPFPDLETQDKIVAVLDKSKTILEKREKTILIYDKLLKSIFIDMFGNVTNNTKGWQKLPLKSFGNIITGNTPPRSDKSNYNSDFIEWIKTNNILREIPILTKAEEYLSEKGFKKSRYVEENALLVTCIAGSIGSIGRSAITDRRVTFNQQINAIVPNSDVSVHFLYWMFKLSSEYIQSFATKGMKRLITKGEFEKILFIKPEYNLQLNFERIALIHNSIIDKIYVSKYKTEDLLSSLSQQAFDGEFEFNTAVNLEVLLENDYAYFKDNADKKAIQLLLERLDKNELNSNKFHDQDMYDKAKSFVFELLKEGHVKQVLDKKTNTVKLTM